LYLESYNKEAKTTIKSHIDFAILGKDNQPIMLSLCDIGVSVRGVMANFNSISTDKYIKIKYYEDITKEVNLDVNRNENQDTKWQYKITKDTEYTNGIIYRKDLIKNLIIDYEGNNKDKLIARFLNDKANIPVTEEIVKLINVGVEMNVFDKSNSNIKAYYISDYDIKQVYNSLLAVKLPLDDSNMYRWEGVNTVNDYVLEFSKEIKDVMDKNIRIRFRNTDLPNMNMFNYNRKPFKGQVALIEAGVRTLKNEQRVIYTAEPSVGKTTLATMSNDLYMQEKGKSNYLTLVVAPNSTLRKWKEEIGTKILGDKVHVEICESTTQFIRFMKNNKLNKPIYIITSKETAKLGFKRYAGINIGTRIVKVPYTNEYGRECYDKIRIKDLAICPRCGQGMLNNARKKDCEPQDACLRKDDFKSIKKSNYKCPNCGEILWSATYQKTIKTSIMDYCHRKNVKFDSVVYDEFHSERSLTSATGNTFGKILNMSDIKILLSGTMNNGNVSSLFPLLMRLIPRKMFKDGYTMKDMDKFIKTYGSLKAIKTIKDDEQKATSRTMFKDSDFSEIAGINPIVFTKYLSDICVSATMDDLGIDLVNYTEYPIEVEMEKELFTKYESLSKGLKSIIPYNFEMYNSSVIRHYCNNPFDWTSMTVKKPTQDGFDLVTVNFPNMNPRGVLNKEDILIELIQEKLKEGRKCLVFTDFTGGHSKYQEGEIISERLNRLLTEQDIKAKTLKASIKPIDRMDYINKYSDTQVWITNPILVKEGLDLIDYPIIIFYNFDYDPLKIQQSSRRAYRSIQTIDCETYYFYYKNSVEEKVMKSITLKKVEMSAIEGKYNVDSFEIIKRTASALGKELYDCIDVGDSLGKLNQNQIKAKDIVLHPEVEKMYT
jgi:ribosomal protein S27AE